MINEEIEMFGFDKELYASNFLPIYSQLEYKPNFILQIPIVLPFELGFDSGRCTTMKIDSSVITFHFTDVTYDNNIWAGNYKSVTIPLFKLSKTRVVMTLLSTEKIEVDEKLSDSFDMLLDNLNLVIRSYLIITKDVKVQRVNREMLEYLTIYRTVTPETWEISMGIFLINTNIAAPKEKLDEEKQQHIIFFSGAIAHYLNPFITSEEMMVSSRRYLLNGNYRETIIFAQTGIETFLSALYSAMLTIEGITPQKIQEMMEKTPFITMLKREFQARIGGSWDVNKISTTVGKWYRETYLLRNKVVHVGFDPEINDARGAIDAANELRIYVIGLLNKSRKYASIKEMITVSSSKKK